MADLEIQVEGMACGGCAQSVTKAIQAVAPGAGVTVDLPTGKVSVTGGISREAVVAAVQKAGYEIRS